MEPLDVYLPMDRRLALARGDSLPDRTQGAVLFADVSGFTSLTEILADELGPQQGAEELSRWLNQIYTALIAPLHRFAGSVIAFSGDAITCWLDADDGLRAAACTLAMQQAMAPFSAQHTPAGRPISLSVKIAAVCGPVRRFLVGDPRIQHLEALAGATLDRVVAAERLARPGETLLGQEIAPLLPADVPRPRWRRAADGQKYAILSPGEGDSAPSLPVSPSPWPEIPPVDAEVAQAWVLRSFYERLRQGPGGFLAELRPAVAFFMQFRGIDYDGDDEAGVKLDAFTRWVQSVVARYEGVLLQLTMGDKGSYFYIVFGAPTAHEDDPTRAVAAALQLRVPPPEFSFIQEVRLGISRGQMWTGAHGSPSRRGYGVIGNEVNVAARLMELAEPGQILVTPRIEKASAGRYVFLDLGTVSLKGLSALLPISRAMERRAEEETRRTSTPLVGREAERALLDDHLRALLQNRLGGLILIEGEAGIGKSRLVEELGQLASEAQIPCLIGAGRSTEQQVPYRAWRDILNALLYGGEKAAADRAIHAAARRVQAQRRIEELAPEQLDRLPLLNDLLGLSFPESPLTAALDPSLRQQNLVQLLLALLRAQSAERPMVLVLEDAHWLDSLSWELTLAAARSLVSFGAPLLLVVVTRPTDARAPSARHYAALCGIEPCLHLLLATLSTEAAIELATARLGLPSGSLPEPMARIVGQRAGGNPFFAEELVSALRDQGLIAVETSPVPRCLLLEDLEEAAQTLPDTVQGIVLARIDRLPPDHQFTLKVAAVIGRTFPYPPLRFALNQYTPIPEGLLQSHLDALSALDLTPLDTPEPTRTYIFKHIITREVAYETLLFSQRRQLHQTVAEWYEGAGGMAQGALGAGPAGNAPLLAYHYHHAGNKQRERHFARLAGEQAAAQFANAEAVSYYSRALELTPEGNRRERYDLLLAREAIYEVQGAREAQCQDLDALQALAAALGPGEQAEAALRRANFGNVTGDYAAAVSSARTAIEWAGRAGPKAAHLQSAAYTQWGQALLRQGKYQEARDRFEWALTLAEDAGLHREQALSRLSMGIAFYHLGDYTHAAACYEQAFETYRQIGYRRGESTACNNLGTLAARQGQLARATDHFNQALRIYRQIGDRRGESSVLNNLGNIYTFLSDLGQARKYQEQALRIYREIGERAAEGAMYNNIGVVALQQGAFLEARESCQQSLRIRREIGDRTGEVPVLTNLGVISFQLGAYEHARTHLEEALQTSRQIGNRQGENHSLSNLGLLFHVLGDNQAGREHSRQAAEIAREVGNPSDQAYALIHLGHALAGLGELDQAEEAYQQALELRQHLSQPNLVAETRAGLAQLALTRGDLDGAGEQTERILEHLEEHSLAGCDEPLRVYLSCFRVLQAAGDPRAPEVLARAYGLLQEEAGKLSDQEARRTFMAIPAHREIARLHEKGRVLSAPGEDGRP